MFSGGLWGAIAPGGESLLDKERNPPAKPIPLEFPSYVPPRCGSPLSRRHMRTLCRDLVSIRKPLDVQDSHVTHLNIQLNENVSLAEMIPNKHFESRPFLYDNDLSAMLTELEIDNEDAYREVLRLPPLEGRKKPRLTYSRNFYASLEDMSRYWDGSKDNYYEVDANEAENPATKPTSPNADNEQQGPRLEGDVEMKDASGNPQVSQDGNDHNSNDNIATDTASNSGTVEIPTRPKLRPVYKGHRLGNGEQMSPGTRVAAVRNLVKMATHKFNCRDYEISTREKFRIRNINLPSVYYNFCVAKLPADVKLARARMVEGPLIAVHCRSEVRFKSRDGLLGPTSDFVGEKYDLFREVGGLLMLAKQRAREGQKLSKEPREDQWWAIKTRWGGGETKWGQLANEIFEDEDPSWSPEERRLQLEKRAKEEGERKRADAASAADLNSLKPEDLMSNTSASNERPKKKKKSGEDNASSKDKAEYKDGKRLMYTPPLRRKWYQDWLKIRPNSPNWDEKIIYKRIGMQNQENGKGGWDDVYMISSVNHHACVLRMSVHEKYLEWLETGKTLQEHRKAPGEHASGPTSDTKQEHVLYVSRSQWYDLFDIEQRKELLGGIWRLLCWINRDELPREEFEKMEELRRKQQQDKSSSDHRMETR
ncbi:uncharacterized protein Z518_01431 [Rhinocladiella mackenziei CBS 650.93]|uniref:Uncharacterized protein n=1 Tax=Rhinocladiella mackenziei CBS 650.93 TaxID=1442369 RepID=A0A0D2IWF9_9EURO|nr:uncharacterized protein Z518_01431 [Rhinocladiella mackenziei CBS 650.93]KIX10349.1 hypothetical protein Z518_01431 [Rhinocladiella mackenziei CBS 650.93]